MGVIEVVVEEEEENRGVKRDSKPKQNWICLDEGSFAPPAALSSPKQCIASVNV